MDDSGRVCGLTYSSIDPDYLDLDTLNSACATSNVTDSCDTIVVIDSISYIVTLNGQ